MPQDLTYSTAKEVLNQADISRLACCFFHINDPKVDYAAAAQDYGAASADSMRVMVNSALRKVRAAATRNEDHNGGDLHLELKGKKRGSDETDGNAKRGRLATKGSKKNNASAKKAAGNDECGDMVHDTDGVHNIKSEAEEM